MSTITGVAGVVEFAGIAAAVGSGLTAGLLFCVAFTMVPAFASLPAGEYLALHTRLGRNVDRVMPAVVLTSTVLDIVSALSSPAFSALFFGVAAGALFGVSVVSHLGNVPINRRVRRLAGTPVPADWCDPRPRWSLLNLVRTGFGIAALLLNCVALATTR